jgi:hypothetical protein
MSVQFVPTNKQEMRALLAYCSTHRESIQQRRASREYLSAVALVRDRMRAHFEQYPAGPRETVCPWRALGTSEMCYAIARKFSVPHWDVSADANPS